MTLIPELQRDLVDAAARIGTRRQRFRVQLRVALAVAGAAAAFIGGALVIVGRDGADPTPSRERAGSPENHPNRTVPERAPEPPRSGGPRPIPGSLSRPVKFEFGGIRYSVVGFRGSRRPRQRNATICSRLTEAPEGPGGPLVSVSCAGEQLLRRELDDHPVRTVGGGGAEYTFESGFARADVTSIALVSPHYPNRVVLSEPWSPRGSRGKPIRFFLVMIDPPPNAPRNFPLRTRLRLEGRLSSGETVEGVP